MVQCAAACCIMWCLAARPSALGHVVRGAVCWGVPWADRGCHCTACAPHITAKSEYWLSAPGFHPHPNRLLCGWSEARDCPIAHHVHGGLWHIPDSASMISAGAVHAVQRQPLSFLKAPKAAEPLSISRVAVVAKWRPRASAQIQHTPCPPSRNPTYPTAPSSSCKNPDKGSGGWHASLNRGL